jgi:GTP cyclohydrolase I
MEITPEKVVLGQRDMADLLDEMFEQISAHSRLSDIRDRRKLNIYGVPRGGVPVSMAICQMLDGCLVDDPQCADVIVDDILDSGATMSRYRDKFPDTPFYALVRKIVDPRFTNKWVVFPWEITDHGVEVGADDIVLRLLQFIGEDPNREGLQETPRRVLKGWREWAKGYGQDPKEILKTFEDGAEHCGDEFVIVHNIPIVSKCEHHLADILGIAHIGYIPNGKIVGLSKLARLADLFARRLQVQERLTNQIADALVEVLEPKGVGVIVRASHACMSTRGVNVHGSVTTTSAMRGVVLDKQAARQEFLALCQAAENHK